MPCQAGASADAEHDLGMTDLESPLCGMTNVGNYISTEFTVRATDSNAAEMKYKFKSFQAIKFIMPLGYYCYYQYSLSFNIYNIVSCSHATTVTGAVYEQSLLLFVALPLRRKLIALIINYIPFRLGNTLCFA